MGMRVVIQYGHGGGRTVWIYSMDMRVIQYEHEGAYTVWV